MNIHDGEDTPPANHSIDDGWPDPVFFHLACIILAAALHKKHKKQKVHHVIARA